MSTLTAPATSLVQFLGDENLCDDLLSHKDFAVCWAHDDEPQYGRHSFLHHQITAWWISLGLSRAEARGWADEQWVPNAHATPDGRVPGEPWKDTPANRERLRTRARPLPATPRETVVPPETTSSIAHTVEVAPPATTLSAIVDPETTAPTVEVTPTPALSKLKKPRRKPTRKPARAKVPRDWCRPTGRAVTGLIDYQRMTKTANADPYLSNADRVVLSEIAAHAGPKKEGGRVIPGSVWEAWPGQTGMARVLERHPTNVGRSTRLLGRAGYLTCFWRRNPGGQTSRLYRLHVPVLGPEQRLRKRGNR